MPHPTDDEWISAGEAAEIIGRSTRQLTRLADEGAVVARRLWSRAHREYLRSSIEALVEAQPAEVDQ